MILYHREPQSCPPRLFFSSFFDFPNLVFGIPLAYATSLGHVLSPGVYGVIIVSEVLLF